MMNKPKGIRDREIKDLYNQIEKLYIELDHTNQKIAEIRQQKHPAINIQQEVFQTS